MQKNISVDSKATKTIARGALTVMVAFIISNLVGLLAKTLTARYFGTGIESNAFFTANRFSEILFNLVAGGALGSAFVPVFTGLLANNENRKAWRLASAVMNLVTIVLVVLSLLTAIFSKQVVHYILAPGFSVDEMVLTAQLLRIQVLSSMIFGISGLVMAALNAHQHFLLPAIAPAMYQIGWITGIFLLEPKMGIFGLAWGVVIGSLLHLAVQIPRLLKLPEINYSFTLGLEMSEVREVIRLMAPRLLGVAVVQLNFLLNTFLASFQSEGSITALSLAFPLMIMPQAVIAQSIAIAALPTFSAQVAKNEIGEMRYSLTATLQAVLILSIPAAVGLILLREQIVTLLYKGSAFTSQSVKLVSWALLWYSVGLVGHCLVEVTSRAFYALHDTKTPVVVGVGAMTGNLLLSILFSAIFTKLGWIPLGGLALANSVATAVESIILLILMRKKLNGINGRKITRTVIKSITASAGMGAVIWFAAELVNFSRPGRFVVLSIIIGVIIYGLLLVLLRSSEIKQVFSMIQARFARKKV
ncbi:MAG: murein biosynthesis integral membrane protein MurJ [Anaerolineaceae bacterium]|nr:murein biosynthesis integral membrane protein MurJ [Anaerolineaceae bacterium]